MPRVNWHCKYCEKKSISAKLLKSTMLICSAFGQLVRVDPVDHLAGRCIHVVKNMEAETYELAKGNLFCSMDCMRINSNLQKLLLGGAEKLSDSSLGIIQMKQERTDVYSTSDLDIRWRLISGKVSSPESQMLLSQALASFHDYFGPIYIVDPIYWHNLIPRMVHRKTMQGRDYRGICCAAMTVNATVVSAGLPLVATHMRSREKILSFLNVESIVVRGFQQLKRQSPYGWVQKTRM